MFPKIRSESAPTFESIVAVIRHRLDAITERDLIPPEEASGSETTIGRLASEQKKLWTLMIVEQRELKPLESEAEGLMHLVQSLFGGYFTPSHIIATAHRKDVQDVVKRIDELNKIIYPRRSRLKIVSNIFWNDVRTMLDFWSEGQLYIEPDWSVSALPQANQAPQHPVGALVVGLKGR